MMTVLALVIHCVSAWAADENRLIADESAGYALTAGELEALIDELASGPDATPWDGRPVNVALLSDQPEAPDRLNRVTLFREAIVAVLGDEFEVSFSIHSTRDGALSYESVNAAVDRLMNDSGVDLVIATDFLGSLALCRRGPLPKPTIASFIFAPEILGVPEEDGRSGVRNLSYISAPDVARRDITAFRDIVGFDHLTILAGAPMAAMVPEVRELADRLCSELGLGYDMVLAADSPEAAAAAISEDSEAVMIAPLIHWSRAQLTELVDLLNERDLPTYSVLGRSEVEAGVLTTVHPAADDERLARRVALNTQRILLGEMPEAIQVGFPLGERLVINMRTARAIGFSPRWDIYIEAELLYEDFEEASLQLTLETAMRRAARANLSLAANEREVGSGEQDVRIARANLLPQVDASSRITVIDEDVASPLQPEGRWTGGVSVQQLVYDESARANWDINRSLQEARKQEREVLVLDTLEIAGTAFLSVLRAKTREEIQRANLQLTRENLELARVRRQIGVGNPSEVYRWESQLAQERIAALDARSARAAAEFQLKQVLNLDQKEPVGALNEDLIAQALARNDDFRDTYVATPAEFRRFVELMVTVGVQAAPELGRLDENIAAQERALLAARRQFYVPTVGIGAEVSHEIDRWGAGSGRGGIGSVLLGGGDDTTWSVGLSASLPLFSGGSRKARKAAAEYDLESLTYRRRDAAARIEQRIRTTFYNLAASSTSIDQSRIAEEASVKNLDLVTDAYSQGAASILDLLDAQNAALSARLAAADFIYQYHQDLVAAARSISRFDFVMSESGESEFRKDIDVLLDE